MVLLDEHVGYFDQGPAKGPVMGTVRSYEPCEAPERETECFAPPVNKNEKLSLQLTSKQPTLEWMGGTCCGDESGREYSFDMHKGKSLEECKESCYKTNGCRGIQYSRKQKECMVLLDEHVGYFDQACHGNSEEL